MKKLAYIILVVGSIVISACSDELNTQPTASISGTHIFENATRAQTAIDGIYRCMYTCYGNDWESENGGQTAYNLMADIMAEDMVVLEVGSGWFYYDYILEVHGDYLYDCSRSYSIWSYYYTIICNANYVIAAAETMEGTDSDVNNVVGQALALRAFAYFNLIQYFQQTYIGNENKPGVPIYTEPTVAGSVGKSRGTVQETYDQINKDIDEAITLLDPGYVQGHCSHIDYYVANGLKARICLTQHKYQEAATAATEALSKPNLGIASVTELGGNNSINVPDMLWGIEIIVSQSLQLGGFFCHMDADLEGGYAESSRKCISTGLYNLISDTDERKSAWFQGDLGDNGEGLGSNTSYCQIKFKFLDKKNYLGDYLLMRAEEMILIKAEAECSQELFAEARTTISQLGTARDVNFENRLKSRIDSKKYNSDTNAPLQTLMDEILLQRRVELWGESGRILDLQRLGLGYSRDFEGSNHTEKITTKDTKAGSPLFILPLPQSEIDGNVNISSSDQNPISM